MNKQALTEALMAFENLKGKEVVLSGRYIIEDAARLVERLLPGVCENCGGTGIAGVHRHIKQSTGEHLGDQDVPCGFCDNGQVWDEGIVEAVAEVLIQNSPGHIRDWEALDLARLALSALVELLTEKVKT